jgi:hypothetical protein
MHFSYFLKKQKQSKLQQLLFIGSIFLSQKPSYTNMLQHAGVLLASWDIDPKLDYGPCAVFLLYHDESIDLM